MNLSKVIAIVGPTASGKSACGIEIAQRFDGEVICVDSRTVYRGMDVGTAKVLGSEFRVRRREDFKHSEPRTPNSEHIPHWGLDLVDPDEAYTVTMFQEYAQKKIQEIVERGKLPILVGGTGLWMDAIIDNLAFPNVPPGAKLRTKLANRGLDELAREYLKLDPAGAEVMDLNNKRRLIRAIEVCRATGKPFSELRQKGPKLYDALWIGVHPDMGGVPVPRILEERINTRVDEMMTGGLVEEVRRLRSRYGCGIPSMSGIGYRELCQYVAGEVELEEAIQNIKTNTRRFARRQMTWFKRREEIVWVKNSEEALGVVGKCLDR